MKYLNKNLLQIQLKTNNSLKEFCNSIAIREFLILLRNFGICFIGNFRGISRKKKGFVYNVVTNLLLKHIPNPFMKYLNKNLLQIQLKTNDSLKEFANLIFIIEFLLSIFGICFIGNFRGISGKKKELRYNVICNISISSSFYEIS